MGKMIKGIKYKLRKNDKIRDVRSRNPRLLAPLNDERNNTEKERSEVRKLKKMGIPLNPITELNPSVRVFTSLIWFIATRVWIL